MTSSRILCPVDCSEQATAVLRRALAMAADRGSLVVVLHALEPLLLQAATAAGGVGALRAGILEELRALADRAGGDLPVLPVVETAVAEGAAHTAILEAASRYECDLIVMGLRGAGGTASGWFGSTLDHVLRSSPVPVLAVPSEDLAGGDDELGLRTSSVVAGVDFDSASMAAARLAASLATERGAELTLVHVVPDAPRWERWQEQLDRQHARSRDRAAHELDWLAAELRAGGTPTFTAVLDGPPAERLAAYCARQPSMLLVLGARGEISRGSTRPGAVASRVLCSGTQPVLIVPSGVPAPRAYTVGASW